MTPTSQKRMRIALLLALFAGLIAGAYIIGAPLLREYREAAYIERLRAPSPFLFRECLVRLEVDAASSTALSERERQDYGHEASVIITYRLNVLELPVGAVDFADTVPAPYYLAFTKDCDARERLAAQLIRDVRTVAPAWLRVSLHEGAIEPGPDTIPIPESDFWRDE